MDELLTTFEGLKGLFVFELTPILLLIVSMISKRFPPKKISKTYGYRTKMSMKNEDTWKTANDFANSKMLQVSILAIAISALLWMVMPDSLGFAIALLITVSLAFWMMLSTEKMLKETFTKDGTRK